MTIGMPPPPREPQPVTPVTPAGWYQDAPTGRMRWWDGTAWTDSYAPVSAPVSSPAPDRKPNLILRASVAIGVLILIGVVVGVGRTVPSDTPPPAPVTDLRQAVSASGDGQTNSAQMDLTGDYTVTWSTAGDCYYSADLQGPNRERLFTADAATAGTGNLYDLEGVYHVEMITGPSPSCPWIVTLTPA